MIEIQRVTTGWLLATCLVAGCGAESAMETVIEADSGVEPTSEQPGELVSVRRAPLVGSCDPSAPTPPPLPNPDGQCFRLHRLIGSNYALDAYTSGTPYVVTRPRQEDDTQTWCFTFIGSNDGHSTYRLRYRNASGLYLDAYTSSMDHRGILNNSQTDGSQDWTLIPECGLARFKQVSTGRYLDAYTTGPEDYRAVTRTKQDDDSQLWGFADP